MNTFTDRAAYRGPALFSYGFRPFFLFGALWAAMAPLLWVSALAGHAPLNLQLTLEWHAHEMLFGYTAAIVAGFLTTSIPNWTGRMPIIGAPLAALFSLWALGRVAMLFEAQAPVAAAVVDASFLVLFAAAVWREILAGKNWRNAPVALLASLLAFSNILFHLRAMNADFFALSERLALGVIALLIALIGGRITPSFTRNWLAQRGARDLPAPNGRLDQVAQAVSVIAIVSWIAAPTLPFAGALLSLAGALILARLSRWRSLGTRAQALVWILHVGYLWLGVALLFVGASILAPHAVPRTAGIHALATGAIGVMTLAVMTRASLGHTGQALHAGGSITAIYLAVNGAAVVRLVSAFSGNLSLPLLTASAVLWCAAFGGFGLLFAPLLMRRHRRA